MGSGASHSGYPIAFPRLLAGDSAAHPVTRPRAPWACSWLPPDRLDRRNTAAGLASQILLDDKMVVSLPQDQDHAVGVKIPGQPGSERTGER